MMLRKVLLGTIANDTRAELWRTAPDDGSINPEDYAMGFTNGHDGIGAYHSHGGMSVGGFSYFVIYPEQQIVVAIAVTPPP